MRFVVLLLMVAQMASASERLTERIESIRRGLGASRISVVFRDLANDRRYALRPNEMYNAASMIKAYFMVAVHAGVAAGRWTLDTPVRVANHFPKSGAGATRATELDRDIHAAIGSTLPLGQLVEAMMARSSNLATNCVVEFVGLAEARRAVAAAGLTRVEVRSGMGRGARHGGNAVSAAGFEELLERVNARTLVSAAASERMLGSLFAQAISNGIPAGLPREYKRTVKIAHKTGNIPTVEHDAALIYPKDRAPYLLAIMTEWPGRGDDHPAALVQVTQAVYEELIAPGAK